LLSEGKSLERIFNEELEGEEKSPENAMEELIDEGESASVDWGMCDECGLKEAEYKHPEAGRELCENCWREMGFG